MREFVVYKGEKFWLQTTGRYFQSGRKDAAERLYHRRVWIDHFGPIPLGLDVHHKDGNWRNTVPSNLELRERIEHARHHMIERNAADPERLASSLAAAREAARRWHGSQDGLAWHSEHGRATWRTRKKRTIICDSCGKSCERHNTHNGPTYCSPACAQRVAFKRYFTDQRNCAYCATPFVANRHRPTKCCSRRCGTRLRMGLPLDKPPRGTKVAANRPGGGIG